MKKYLLTACAVLLTTSTSAYGLESASSDNDADGYPMTQEERKEKEIGSVLGGEGLTFHPNTARNESTVVANSKINPYLWQASLEMIDAAPLALVDTTNGVISTEWYSSKEHPNTSTKITAKIVGNTIAPESVVLTMHKRTMKNGRWIEEKVQPNANSALEAKILNRARDLFAKGKK